LAEEKKSSLASRDAISNFHRVPILKVKRRSVRTEAIKLVRGLSTTSSWDDLMYRIYVRQKIDAGLADFRAGRVHPHSAIRKEFELS
jgi:predicted transcriptional regulator